MLTPDPLTGFAALFADFDVVRCAFAATLVEVDDVNVAAYALNEPDGCVVGDA